MQQRTPSRRDPDVDPVAVVTVADRVRGVEAGGVTRGRGVVGGAAGPGPVGTLPGARTPVW